MESQDSDKMEVEKLGESEEQISGNNNDKSGTGPQKNRICKAPQGRPPSKKTKPQTIYAERPESLLVYEHWSEHKRVLLALELQYCFNLCPSDAKSKKIYECGFLIWGGKEQSKAVDKPIEFFKDYKVISFLKQIARSADCPDPDRRDLADMVDLALSVKNEAIWEEWLIIYEEICRMVEDERNNGNYFISPENRRNWENQVAENLLMLIEEKMPERFPESRKLISKESRIDFVTLLKR